MQVTIDEKLAELDRREAAFNKTTDCLEALPDGSIRVLAGAARAYFEAVTMIVPDLRAELEAARMERDQAISDRDRYWKCSEDAERKCEQMVEEIDEAIEVKVLLAQQCEEAEAKLVTACDDVRFFEERLAAARAEVEALRADLNMYASHLPSCPLWIATVDRGEVCTCKLDAARARWEKEAP